MKPKPSSALGERPRKTRSEVSSPPHLRGTRAAATGPLVHTHARLFVMLRCTAVWGDEKDKFSSSKLWKTKWSILPREEKIPEEWIADKYHGMWSKQTDTPEQFKDQWESGAIRMAQFALKLDVGRFGSYPTPLVGACNIFLSLTRCVDEQRQWSRTVCRSRRATWCLN